MTTAKVRNQFRVFNAANFLESLSETSPDVFYLFIGKVNEWTDDTNPDSPTDKRSDVITDYSDMIAAKKVLPTGVSHGLPRVDWTSGVAYSEYDDIVDDLTALSPAIYVLTDDFSVYKCLSNNGGIASLNKPTGTSTTEITTGDGYIWKFMYNISSSQALRFVTKEWMPLPTGDNKSSDQIAVESAAVAGAIHKVVVTNGGSDYATAPTVAIFGDGVDATATATVVAGIVTNITISNKGSGYSYATVSFSGGGGSGATARSVISPQGGHGSDSVDELGGFYIITSVDLQQDENGVFPTTNEYRKIGLLKNPNNFGDSSAASDATVNQTTTITFAAGTVTGDFQEDEFVYQGASLSAATAKGRVVSWDAASRVLSLIDVTKASGSFTFPHFQSDLKVTGNTSGAIGDGTAGHIDIDEPDLEPDSGEIIYIEHKKPISRSSDQTENIRLIIEY